MVSEMSVIFNQLTRLIARQDFIDVSHRESFRSCTLLKCFVFFQPPQENYGIVPVIICLAYIYGFLSCLLEFLK
jgi:hypothetical protein